MPGDGVRWRERGDFGFNFVGTKYFFFTVDDVCYCVSSVLGVHIPLHSLSDFLGMGTNKKTCYEVLSRNAFDS